MAEQYSYPAARYLLIGKIAKAHGLRGEVKIVAFSGQPENFRSYREVALVDAAGGVSPGYGLETVRIQGRSLIVRLTSVSDRNQAELLEGRGVLLAKELLPEAAEDEYYWYQYQGKLVRDLTGRTIGTVRQLFNNGAQDVLVVQAGQQEILIPVTKDIVVGETEGELLVDLPPGLVELNVSGS